MNDSLRTRTTPLQFYTTAPYECSYLENQLARSQVAVPAELIDSHAYSQLVQHGFRRSGSFVYRPWCDYCKACIPVRLPVAQFKPDRAQRRAQKRHAGLQVRVMALEYKESHYLLYQRYQLARHAGGGMDKDNREQYQNFILKSNVGSFLAEFSLDNEIQMVSLIDQLDDGISSVYTFYNPDLPNSSLGVFNILWQISLAAEMQLSYVYLGYWIDQCRKMAYKARYRPIEGLFNGCWQSLPIE
ncbi:arginyltransferase [Iodobacter ciconiae]|uniref:Aspartate/glutamate leucyltransferase n=1 Tax=Iodobacter ciconiae TaxID=2496266 RepID=A0A3S8ZT54_9NEIS|nr:arginyltransferase [Iodobacter ciconiae]AZN36646.1 arginyltransferase [Iodobacter ciconiae]